MDYLDSLLTVEVKSFKSEVNILCNRYHLGNPDRWNALYISGEIIKTYNNMFEDGTWKREIGKKDQIIALTTKLTEMQAKFDHQIASLATQAKKKDTHIPASNSDSGPCRSKKSLIQLQHGTCSKRKTHFLSMAKIIAGAPVITTVAV
jgi:hypothetical protein